MKVLQTDYHARLSFSSSNTLEQTCLYTHVLNLGTRAINRRMIPTPRIVESAQCLL